MPEQPNPITLFDTAIALHEVFDSLIKAGFTRDEALILLLEMVRDNSN